MSKKWLIIDSNFLCHRVKHSMGGLVHGNTPTGIIYGFLKTVIALQEQFRTPHVVFCWDSLSSKRNLLFPDYKKKRKSRYKEMTKEEEKFEKNFRIQMKRLRRVYLRQIGYRNIFCQKGYEGDDMIASVCLRLPTKDSAIIITADKDMYQLIRHNITFYNPQQRKMVTVQSFKKEYGILPEQWVLVKCYAGCSTDEVPGIKGVGEKTAIRYIQGELKKHLKVYQKLHSQKTKYIKRNHPLVGLPFKDTKTFKLKKDRISEQGWKEVAEKLGMSSLKEKAPIGVRVRRRHKHAVKNKKHNRKLY